MNRSEMASLLRAPAVDAQPGTAPVVISEPDPRKFMTAFATAVAGKSDVFLCDPRWSENERKQVAAVLASQPGLASPKPGNGEGGWLMIPTGGTSGQIKFARHDGHTLAAAVRGFTQHFGLKTVNAVGLLPLHHVSGLMAWMRCLMTEGEYLSLDWKAIEAGKLPVLPGQPEGWVLSLVPTQLERLVRSEATVDWLQRFRIIFLGGAPAWPALLERAAELRLPISIGYGMTETAAMITALRPQEFLAGIRSNGSPLPHGNVRIGELDRVILDGASLFRGYYPAWRETRSFATQDRGRLDAQGQLYVLGRVDAVIITGGEKVEPLEIEAVLRSSGEFSDVVVLGLPDPTWGQSVAAVYPASTRPNMVRVNAALATLSPIKHPKHFLPIAEWPVNAQGKVNRGALLERAVAQRVSGNV